MLHIEHGSVTVLVSWAPCGGYYSQADREARVMCHGTMQGIAISSETEAANAATPETVGLRYEGGHLSVAPKDRRIYKYIRINVYREIPIYTDILIYIERYPSRGKGEVPAVGKRGSLSYCSTNMRI